MLFYYRKSSISKMIVLIIYALGIYQFSEYMLCTSNTTAVWAKVGFITYTFLPAMGLDFALIHTKKKHNRLLVFLVPIIISLFVIVNKKFIIESFCNTHFVTVRHFFFEKEKKFAASCDPNLIRKIKTPVSRPTFHQANRRIDMRKGDTTQIPFRL